LYTSHKNSQKKQPQVTFPTKSAAVGKLLMVTTAKFHGSTWLKIVNRSPSDCDQKKCKLVCDLLVISIEILH